MNEQQHLPYWKLENKWEKVFIVSQTLPTLSPIHHQRGLYFHPMNYYAILKEHLQVFHKIHPKYFQIALDRLSVLKFPLVEIETSFPIRFFLCTYIEMYSIQKKEDTTKVQVNKYISTLR